MGAFRIGEIIVEPGAKAGGFMPSLGLGMRDGTGNFWNIPVVFLNGAV